MLDRTFLRPIAHRGLHDAARGVIENTGPAFEAAIAAGCGIECDIRPAAEALPIVFHDATLERLVDAEGSVAALQPSDLKRLRHRVGASPILAFAEMLELVAERAPLLVEIKSDWTPPDLGFLKRVTEIASSYRGPLALMSFDPAVMTAVRELAPAIPRGIVAADFTTQSWWRERFDAERAYRLSNLLESGPSAPDFFAYDVKALPTPVTRFIRASLQRPLFTWTVRSNADRTTAFQWADAPIFEGEVPAMPIPS